MPSPAAAALRAPLARLPRPSLRTAVAVALAVAGLAGGWMWLRDSRLVAVRQGRRGGVGGPDADRVRERARRTPPRDMTTLHVRDGRAARRRRAVPRSSSASRAERRPPARAAHHRPRAHPDRRGRQAGSQRAPVAADGTVMRGDAERRAAGGRRQGPRPAAGSQRPRTARRASTLLAAAPARPARARRSAWTSATRGWTLRLRDGPIAVLRRGRARAGEVGRRGAVLADPSVDRRDLPRRAPARAAGRRRARPAPGPGRAPPRPRRHGRPPTTTTRRRRRRRRRPPRPD